MASPVELAFRRAVADLDALKVRWALIGGPAISVRSAPRFLAGRNQDLTDLGQLIPSACAADLDTARDAVRLIRARGFNREQDVVADLDKLIADLGR